MVVLVSAITIIFNIKIERSYILCFTTWERKEKRNKWRQIEGVGNGKGEQDTWKSQTFVSKSLRDKWQISEVLP